MDRRNKTLLLRFDRVLANDLRKQALILIGLFVILFVLSYILLSFSGSDWRGFCEEHNLQEWLLPLYLLIDTNALNNLYIGSGVNGWMLFASSITYLAGLFVFNGMIISVMTNAISSRVERHTQGLIHYLKSGHYIIMGYDDMCPSIIDSIFSKDKNAYILILTSASPVKIKEKLRRSLGEQQLNHIIINYGHRMSREEYGAIHLESAREIFIVGNRTLPAHDAINMECVANICAYLRSIGGLKKPDRITCVFEDLDTYAAFKTSDFMFETLDPATWQIFGAVRGLDIEFVPYNFYAGWASQIFVKQCYRNSLNSETINYPAVYGDGIREDDDRNVHLVFVGTTNFGVAFAMEAAHLLHFPNYNRDRSLKTRITFIDLNADSERHVFITRNRHFFDIQDPIYRDLSDSAGSSTAAADSPTPAGYSKRNFLDTEFEFIKGDIFSPTIREELKRWAADDKQHLSIFLAMANQRNNFAIGMNMPDEIYDRKIPVFIRQDRSDNFVTNLRDAAAAKSFDYCIYDEETSQIKTEKRNGRYANIYPFGMNNTGYSADDDRMLKMAKLVNYLYATADYSSNKFTDMAVLASIPQQIIAAKADRAWGDLPVANKWSNLYVAYGFSYKLATLRAMRGLKADDTSLDMTALNKKEVEILAVVEHNRWNVEKLLMGFRKPRPAEDKYEHPEYGSELGQNKKLFIHHDIRPYEELSEKAKQLDREFSKYIPWILKMTSND